VTGRFGPVDERAAWARRTGTYLMAISGVAWLVAVVLLLVELAGDARAPFVAVAGGVIVLSTLNFGIGLWQRQAGERQRVSPEG
jgi:hypothetical protein